MTKSIYKFYWDCGRNGHLSGIFVASDKEIKEIIGEHIRFGEVLGKHSEISGTLKKDDIEKLVDGELEKDFVEKFESLELDSGFNPLDYYERMEHEEDEEDEEN